MFEWVPANSAVDLGSAADGSRSIQLSWLADFISLPGTETYLYQQRKRMFRNIQVPMCMCKVE